MKVFIALFALAAVAVAEPAADSDAELVYTDGTFHTNVRNLNKGVHYPYTAGKVGAVYNSVPTAYAAGYAAPYTTAGYVAPYTAAGYAASPYHRFYKREAEADSEAQYLAYNPYSANAYSSYYRPSAYTYGNVAAYSPYVNRLYKREAEADSDSDSQYLAYSGVPATTLGYRSAVYPYASTYAHYPYAHHGAYAYNPLRIAKREAESDAQYYLPSAYAGSAYAGSAYYRPSVYSGAYNTYPHYNRAAYYY